MGKYHEFYDKINLGKKNYEKEVEDIFSIYKKFSNLPMDKVLEVGCGTGNHTKELLKSAKKVYATDVDIEMIKLAENKLKGENVSFYCGKVPEVKEKNFPLCVMMWHVINYFPDIKTINQVFKSISERLTQDGLFFFDMWNGVSVIRDLPRNEINRINFEDTKIIHTLEGKTNLMDQTVDILNTLLVIKEEKIIDNFSENVRHYIWTFKTIRDLLSNNGLKILKVVKANDYDKIADENDWKIMIIAQKNNNESI